MRSITIPEPTFPTIYCQLTEENQVSLSLMSSVVQRDVRSKRFDRNQDRQVVVVTTPMTISTFNGLTKHQLTSNSTNSYSTFEYDHEGETLLPVMPTRNHTPQGNFRSDIVIIVLCKINYNDCDETCDSMDAHAFVQYMTKIATNRGHTVIEILSAPSLESDHSQQLLR